MLWPTMAASCLERLQTNLFTFRAVLEPNKSSNDKMNGATLERHVDHVVT